MHGEKSCLQDICNEWYSPNENPSEPNENNFTHPVHCPHALPAILLVVFYKKTKFGTVAFRTIPLLKIFIISFCWMWTCAILPQVLIGSEINWDIAVFEFFFVLFHVFLA